MRGEQDLLAAKAECAAWLEAYPVGKLRLGAVDKRLPAYIKAVASRPDQHCVWEVLACRRFIRMVECYGLNAAEVRRFFLFYESLYFPGQRGPQHYALTPCQAFQFASIFGFWNEGKRVVKEAVLFVPRKFSKTTGTASLAVYDLLFGEANGEAYVGANSSDQAKKCFDIIRGCVRKLDPKGKRYVVNEERIKSRRADRSAFAQCLTANANTKDGLNASLVIMDEFSQARNAELLSVLTTSMGARANPLTIIITTASDKFEGPFYSMLQGYKQILLGEAEDDSVFAHLFEPDPGDAEGDPATWRKVHPHLGVTVSEEFYRREWQSAQRNGAEAMLAFRTKLLNKYAENQQQAWISATLARQISKPITWADLAACRSIVAAFDLSESNDLTAVTAMGYLRERATFLFKTQYFFPRGALAGHPSEKLFRAWAEGGHLTLTDGPVISYEAVRDYILGMHDVATLQGVGFDGWKAKDLQRQLESAIAAKGGNPSVILVQVPQGYGHFTSAVEMFEHAAKTGHAIINDNPINAYCFGNAVLDFDNLENCKPVKRHANQKIDGVITKLMALKIFIDRS